LRDRLTVGLVPLKDDILVRIQIPQQIGLKMNLETIISILTLLGFGGIIGAYFTHLFEKRKEIELHFRERKEDQYKKFLENLIGFFEGWEKLETKKEFMRELYTHAPLYASSKVIRLANSYIKSFANKRLSSKERDKLANKLVIAIRKELGVDKKDPLNESDVKRYKLD
jgi:hypothetical protein